jgi:tetratricopeptide (TPR) repeat protein
MKIALSPLALALCGICLASLAPPVAAAAARTEHASPVAVANSQKSPAEPPSAEQQPAGDESGAAQPNRAEAYYHFQLGHMNEELAVSTGNPELAAKAIEEYKTALKDDPDSSYLRVALASLYANTGDIRNAIRQAEDVISRDPSNLDARRLLGRIYLRLLSEPRAGDAKNQARTLLRLAIEQYEQIVVLDSGSMEDHLLLGRLYRMNSDTAKAESEFRAAVKLQPDSEEAVTTLALLFIEEGAPGRALDLLVAVPEANRTPRLESVLGYAYMQKKDYPHAVKAYGRAVEMDPSNLDAVRGLAEALYNNRQPEAALKQFQKIATADPQDAQTLMRIAEIYRQDGKFDKALEALNKAQSIVQDSIEIDFHRAVVQQALGKFDEAAGILESLLKRSGSETEHDNNNRAIFLERLGSVYRDQNKVSRALETYRKLLPLGGETAIRAYQLIVDLQRERREYKAALATSREAVAKYPNDAGLKMLLAAQEADLGDADAALARVKDMLSGDASKDRDVWLTLAQINARLRRFPESEKCISKALELSTEQGDKSYANFVAGSIYEQQKKNSAAERAFRKVLATDPNSATTLNYLGYMLADRGVRLDEALKLIHRAVELDPQNGAYLDSLGWVHFRMGKYDLAEAALRKAAERIGNDPTVYDHLGDLYLKTGRLKLAVTQWKLSLEAFKRTLPADIEPGEPAKVRKKLDAARIKLAKEEGRAAQ